MEVKIKDEFIKLGQLLKLAGVVEDGVEAKYVIQDGLVLVNGEREERRGKKIYENDVVSFRGEEIKVIR
ncbi:RNA-binding protein [Blautia sp. An249]|uniref:RNA-binding S4 domain-containing protein n=1 Tax=Blautia sp. An249 TaxID=1965603 RepID=UPI000B383EEE|nr:RNA-binding S4 domain-containing protein [Blautia sp. An249]OUO77426.1 RNA-binding protein [Blautia sp. An249]